MAEEKDVILDVQNLKMYFKTAKGFKKQVVKAVDDVSFQVLKGQTLGLVGESGCGKTTTGKCILRINDPTDGHIIYKGRDIARLKKSELRENRRDIQLIFQDPYGSLNPRQNLRTILKDAIVGDHKPHTAEEIRREIDRLLTLVELSPLMADRYPHELSGGQRQRLGIARALACKPTLIVCDEPVSALDVSIQAQIINLFERLKDELGLTYVFIAHDIAVVKHIADVIAVMYLGHIVEMMDAKQIFRNPVHPYTRSLLSAVPTVDYDSERTRERIILQGEVPSPTHAPSGCPFHPRCVYAKDICSKECPALKDIGDKHSVACHFAEQFSNEK
ncbi:MAG: ABC transporter ATP-binding protein [Spirochaetales bacterium]|nr:ABC transporter ATP-binding protein [Spirochaetales bacterium]